LLSFVVLYEGYLRTKLNVKITSFAADDCVYVSAVQGGPLGKKTFNDECFHWKPKDKSF